MLFQSTTYLFYFLPLVWVLFLLVGRTRLRTVLFTISGYIFYAWGEPWIAILLLATSTLDFLVGQKLEKTISSSGRKKWLLVSLIFNLGLLAFFKYGGWAAVNLNLLFSMLGVDLQVKVLKTALPPGISFYTFQSLSYVIDIYRGKIPAHRRIWNYWAFIAFFPQLIAGPIERAGHLLDQVIRPRMLHPRLLESGIFMIAWGLFKKLVVADNLSSLVELCRQQAATPGAGLVLALAFTFQIYADFSAYTDIARGSARLFGIRLYRNFKTPYFALNPSDFWNRWHITLSRWLRDYLYIPLGGNRDGRITTLRNLIITMFLAGLWHGAGWYFIAWGLYHGGLLVLYRLLPIDRWLITALGNIGAWLARLWMFCLVVAGWVLFRAGEGGSLSALFTAETPPEHVLSSWALAWGLILFTAPVVITDAVAFRYRREFTDLWPHMARWMKVCIYVIIFYGLVFFGARDSHEFIYFQF